MLKVKAGREGTVSISGELTIGNVEELYSELTKVFNDGICTTLDLSGVTDIDTSALQVLAAFKKALLELNRPIACPVSEAVQDALELSGISRLFKAA